MKMKIVEVYPDYEMVKNEIHSFDDEIEEVTDLEDWRIKNRH